MGARANLPDTQPLLNPDPDARLDHLPEDVEEELAAVLPETQGSRFGRFLSGAVWHFVAVLLLAVAAHAGVRPQDVERAQAALSGHHWEREVP